MRGSWQLGVLLALLVATTDAWGEEHATAVLDYESGATLPPTCPDRDAFASAVATRLGYDPFTGDGPNRTALSVRYRREGKTLAVTLRHGETEKRLASLTGACEELGSAAAFAAAIFVDPRGMFPRPPPRAEPAPPGAPRSEGPPSPGIVERTRQEIHKRPGKYNANLSNFRAGIGRCCAAWKGPRWSFSSGCSPLGLPPQRRSIRRRFAGITKAGNVVGSGLCTMCARRCPRLR